jgi:hypothetical protein
MDETLLTFAEHYHYISGKTEIFFIIAFISVPGGGFGAMLKHTLKGASNRSAFLPYYCSLP